jgi:hypothetical protein
VQTYFGPTTSHAAVDPLPDYYPEAQAKRLIAHVTVLHDHARNQ